eukprot:TRINITY_DN414_c0_g1_i4.p1 TRINITY_DN414_c0_g1~~TRINITY_DN414_c0_g1_i4.p1  ORF type:complete len:429 (+),score=193.69 TRINITY_DN414_c0_g1_i4:69-1289(+)
MRRAVASAGLVAGRRGLCGVAPVLHFPKVVTASREEQVAKNTSAALDLLRAKLGDKPEAYQRKYSQGIADIQKEIEATLKACGTEAAPLEDGKELTSIQVIERVLRHGVLSYMKAEGTYDWESMEKWLVYTGTDSQEYNRLRREVEGKAKYAEYKATNTGSCVPNFNWEEEYAAATDREAVAEKRKRYDAVAASTFDRDEAAISAEMADYRKPSQDKLLDTLVEQLVMFKPFLAKQVIQAKLIERNADGQMTLARFVDWNPDARDVAEAEFEAQMSTVGLGQAYGVEEGYKRYADVRMRTKEEVLERMERKQQEMAASSAGGGSTGAADAKRAALMAEILKLQNRGAKDTEEKEEKEEEDPEAKEARLAAEKAAHEKEMERYQVSDSAVQAKGLIGLAFLSKAEAA